MGLRARLGLLHPLIVAPMAGGPTTPELVIASCEAGALGSLGSAYSNPSVIRADAERVRVGTLKPFAINLFVPGPASTASRQQIDRAVQATSRYREELSLPAPTVEPPFEEDFAAQFNEVLRIKPAVLSYVFGVLNEEQTRAAHAQGILLAGGATSLEEALTVERSGADAVVLQGFEAGGHRALLDSVKADPQIGCFELLRQCKGRLKIPIIAAGGIMNSRDIQRALDLGAEAVQMGTAFLDCAEAGTSKPYRQSLRGPRETKTTRVFSGRFARGIKNRFLREMELVPQAIMPFPIQNKFTRDLRKASLERNLPDFLSLWSGTGEGELFQGSARELISQLFEQK